MQKNADAFRSIGEVAKIIGVAPHVLRYWETQFSLLRPMKRPDGRRYYRPDDVRLAAGLCELLREEGLTIRGAKKLLARDRGESVRQRGAAKLAEAAAPAADHASTADEDLPMTAPRARRRRRPQSEGAALPLFAEPDDNGTIWLARLAALATRLRDQDRLPDPAAEQAMRLQNAVLRLYPA